MAAGERSVYSSSGSRTFSSSVIEPNNAPDWYMTPNLRMISRRSSSPAEVRSLPLISTRPASGGLRLIMCFNSVVLPDPEPPRITNTSPACTSKLRSRKITFSS